MEFLHFKTQEEYDTWHAAHREHPVKGSGYITAYVKIGRGKQSQGMYLFMGTVAEVRKAVKAEIKKYNALISTYRKRNWVNRGFLRSTEDYVEPEVTPIEPTIENPKPGEPAVEPTPEPTPQPKPIKKPTVKKPTPKKKSAPKKKTK